MAVGHTIACVNSCGIFFIKILHLPCATAGIRSFAALARRYVPTHPYIYMLIYISKKINKNEYYKLMMNAF